MVVNEIKWISQIVINVTDSIGEKKYNLQNDIFDKIASTMNMFDHVGAEQYGRVFCFKNLKINSIPSSKVFFFLDGEKLVAEEEGGNTYKKP